MPGTSVAIGPWSGGLHNASGTGESIEDDELFELVNLEVDTDKSLANRPAIRELALSGMGGVTTNIKVIGTYLPDDGRKYLVATVGAVVWLIDANTGIAAVSQPIDVGTCIQYNNRLWIIPVSAGAGGFFDVPTSVTLSWTADADIPPGTCAVIYKERMFVTNGSAATTNTSRVYFSNVGDPTVWTPTDNFDTQPGNGQRLVYMVVVGDSIMLFKEHSTYNFGYASDPAKFDIKTIDTRIGVPAINCAVAHKNNTLYVLHDNAVYELYNNVYTKISSKLAMEQIIDPDLYGSDTYGLTLYRDRLFVRYYSRLYVLGLELQRWSEWETERKFSRIAIIPTADVGLDTAYAASATSAQPGKIFFFRDDRITEVGVAENFNCRVVTKLYDYQVPSQYKRLFMAVLQIATSGTTTITARVPNAGQNPTWNYWKATYTWDSIKAAGIKWSSNPDVMVQNVITVSQGAFARKALKCLKKMRFRQIQFTISTAAETNNIANAAVRIYDLTTFVLQAETLVKATS